MKQGFDVAVVGAGIVGLAHALAAARLGKRVVVVDRDAQANGASVRNFGFVTVTGQERGAVWSHARRSADVWREVAAAAGVEVLQRGLTMVARRPEAKAVLEAFLETEMSEGCAWRDVGGLGDQLPVSGQVLGGLLSSVDLRVESRTAIPRVAAWLEAARGVTFLRGVAVRSVETGRLETSSGVIEADAIVVCPGDDLVTLFPDAFARAGVTRCKLQMLRLAAPGWRLPSPVMSDLGLVRYLGYADLPEAAAVRARLEAEQAAHLEHGVHLIVAQSADGSLVVGDSHHYAPTPDPFARDDVDALILDEFTQVFGQAPPAVLERWTGTYASAAGHSLVETPMPNVRLVVVTGGTGASTGFGLAETVVADLFDLPQGAFA
ncbi:TIGR03364 family FAD-dependent oxidoreductase [Caulobacter vibrioides]|uniref:TIGR03364 family FAD-dependent oxidoreductase n=1 Tax=Caulobacter vibrioides TaxID=155892 RepID=A0A290MMJ8_CAUVI|nr:TIGR03364 family FAD-dependent oxidoreductase [Caulobacter vibrioides]ATC32995.1 TIGR03364 family FAD-dependent oxidoreductase [Caulobacter vibrioides]